MSKILFKEGGVINKEGLQIYFNEIISEYDLEELKSRFYQYIDKAIEYLKEDIKGHKVTKGIVIYPLIHLIHDEKLSKEEENIINQSYAKNLN